MRRMLVPDFTLNPETYHGLPMVERMEIDRFYVNYNNVYQHPIAFVDTEQGRHVVIERFYRPASWEWIERSAKIHYKVKEFRKDPMWAAIGRQWFSVVALTELAMRSDRGNPTWEIPWEHWKEALDDPKIWQ